MSASNIDLSSYLDRIGGVALANTFSELLGLLHPVISDMAQDIEKSLTVKEKLNEIEVNAATKETVHPLLSPCSFECYFWAMEIISSVFTAWVFTAKSNDPKYEIDNRPASRNATIAKRFVRYSITKAIALGRKAVNNKATNFTPQGMVVK